MRNDDLALRDLSEIADAIAAEPHHLGRRRPRPALPASRSGSRAPTPSCASTRTRRWSRPRAMDAELAAGKRRGPLHGVPMAHKDMYYRKGELSTGGSAIRRDWRAPVTATVLEQARCGRRGRAGLPQHGGVRRRPDRPQRASRPLPQSLGRRRASPAAARAARAPRSPPAWSMARWAPTPAARSACPPSACGVVGMKATYGRVSRAGAVARSWSLDHVGPLTRTVRDNARMLARRRRPRPRRFDDQREAGARLRGAARGRRGGPAGSASRCPNDGLAPLDAQVGAAVQAAADALGKLGARISPATLPDFTALYRSAEVMVKCEAAAMHRPWMEKRPRPTPTRCARAWRRASSSRRRSTSMRCACARISCASSWRPRWTASMPCAAGHPLPHPDHRGDRRREVGRAGHAQHGRRASPASRGPSTRSACRRCRCPAASTANGAPIGLQLVGRPFDEALLYRIGHAYQGATDHHQKVPV